MILKFHVLRQKFIFKVFIDVLQCNAVLRVIFLFFKVKKDRSDPRWNIGSICTGKNLQKRSIVLGRCFYCFRIDESCLSITAQVAETDC